MSLLSSKFEALLRSRLNLSQAELGLSSGEIKIPPPPTASISQINSYGMLKISFSNKIMIPKELLSMDDNGRIKIKFDQEDKRRLQTEIEFEVLSVQVHPGEDSLPENLKFNWKPIQINEDGIEIQLNFDSPLRVSTSGDKDEVEVKILKHNFFIDKYGQTLQEDITLKKNLPNQFPDADQAKRIAQSSLAL